jgi:DNA-binding transcriptional MocR family regulator
MRRWAYAARQRGVLFDAGTAFTLDRSHTPGARLGFACIDAREIKEAVSRLTSAARWKD